MSRNFFLDLQINYKKKGIEVKPISLAEIYEMSRWLNDSPSLFSEKRVFVTEFLNRKIKKDNKKILAELERLAKLKDVEMVDWEDAPARFIKIAKLAKVKEFKPDKTVFKLLDSLYPGNKKNCLQLLSSLSQTNEDNFIFHMLVRQVRYLIMAKQDVMPPKMQSWQFGKLKQQTKSWDLKSLIDFYQGLYRIEVAAKTSRSPYSIKQSLDILAMFYL